MLYISGLRRLEKPSLDLSLTRTSPELADVSLVAALPGGEAVVYKRPAMNILNDEINDVLKVDTQGRVTQVIYSCEKCPSGISGLLVLGDKLYIVTYYGRVLETSVSDGRVISRSTIPGVGSVVNTGSLYSKPEKIPDKQTLLLCDSWKGEVFTFKPSTGQKQVRVTGLSSPRSVSYFFYNNTVYYIVCEYHEYWINIDNADWIKIYNQTWDLIRTIGFRDTNDGILYMNKIYALASYEDTAIVSDEDTIIISDYQKNRISEFSFNGTFLRHLLDKSDGIYHPYSMSYYYPYLWLVQSDFPRKKLHRYNLYG